MSDAECSLACALIKLEYELEKLLAIMKIGMIIVPTTATMQLLTVALVALGYLNFIAGSATIVLTGAVAIAVNETLPRIIAVKKLRRKYGEKLNECITWETKQSSGCSR